MSTPILEDHVRASYRWLGHQDQGGYTELGAFHPDYRPGRENVEWNKSHDAFPRIAYATTEQQVVQFACRQAGSRLVCYSLNPRTGIFLNDRAYPRSGREHEIGRSQNLLLDFDLDEGAATRDRARALEALLDRVDGYFLDQGFLKPVRAFSGGGYHVLAAYPPITTSSCPDIALRLRAFRDQLQSEFDRDLRGTGVKLDHTHDLRRLVKIYGTAKPELGVQSRFLGRRREPDKTLGEYLRSLDVRESHSSTIDLAVGRELPNWFEDLVQKDRKLGDLWDGVGKSAQTDTTRSGYDFSVAQRLLDLGRTDVAELATILSLRPDGAVQRSGKDNQYVRRTIASVLMR